MIQRQPGAMLAGLGLVAVGGWIIVIALGQPLVGFDRLWPALVAFAGLALTAQYTFHTPRYGGMLFVGVMLLLLGLFFLPFALRIGGISWSNMIPFWPVLPLIVAFAFAALYLADGMSDQTLLTPIYIIGGVGLAALPITTGVLRGTVLAQVIQLWPLVVIGLALAFFLRPHPRPDGHDHED